MHVVRNSSNDVYRIKRRIEKCKRRIEAGKNVQEETQRLNRLIKILFGEGNNG